MAADLHIHTMQGVTESDLAEFFSHTLGSRWFDMRRKCDFDGEAWRHVSDSPEVWVGEVSWLKAGLTDDAETFVPQPVAKVSEIIGEGLPVCNDALIERIREAMSLPNSTGYSLASAGDVLTFLNEHKGERLFSVSW